MLIHILQDQKLDQVLVLPEQNMALIKLPENFIKVIFRQKQFTEISLKMQRQTALVILKIKTRVLVATDIAARGIDIDDLKYVINFELSDVSETYVHKLKNR